MGVYKIARVQAVPEFAAGNHYDLLEYIYGDHLTGQTMPNKDRLFVNQDHYGYTTLAQTKEDVKRKNPPYARSYPTLFTKVDEEHFLFFRPHLSFSNKSHKTNKIRWLTGLFFDFDQAHLQALGIHNEVELMEYIEDQKGLKVLAIIRSSTGLHAWLPMETTHAHKAEDDTIGRYGELLRSMTRYLGSDPYAAKVTQFFRVPNSSNIAYLNLNVEKQAMAYYEEKMTMFAPVIPKIAPESDFKGCYVPQRGIQLLLEGKFTKCRIKGREVGRNNAAYTLAKAFLLDGYSQEFCLEKLREWHGKINHSKFPFTEVEATVKNAYRDGKKLSGYYIEALTGVKFHPITKAKKRGERQNHFSEIEKDIVRYLAMQHERTGKHLEGVSNGELTELINQAFGYEGQAALKKSSLEKAIRRLKDRGDLQVEKVRVGRSYVSKYVLEASLLNAEKSADNVVNLNEYKEKHVLNVHTSDSYTGLFRATGYVSVLPFLQEADRPQKQEDLLGLFDVAQFVAATGEGVTVPVEPVGGVKNADIPTAFSVGGVNEADLQELKEMLLDAENWLKT